MKPIFIPLIFSLIFGILNIYCFLLQRTTRKIRQYGYGTAQNNTEAKLLPDWYFWVYFLSFLRFPFIIWLFTINWGLALILLALFWFIKVFYPINDYKNVQIIKKNVERKMHQGEPGYFELYDLVLEVEEKTI